MIKFSGITLINKILFGAIIIFSLLAFMKGCSYGKTRVKCPTITTNIKYIHDTITRETPNYYPYYIQGKDSIIYQEKLIPAKVDTIAILHDYYAKHIYNRQWKDSLLDVQVQDQVTKNEISNLNFKYKILRAQTIINNTQDNSITYSHYIYGGVSMPIYPFKQYGTISNINYIGLNMIYAAPKMYLNVKWTPYIKGFEFGIGIKILQFKTKK